MGSAEEGAKQAVFNQIWLKSGQKSLKIMCFQRYKAYLDIAEKVKINPCKIWLSPSDPICIRPLLPSADTSIPEQCMSSNYNFTHKFKAKSSHVVITEKLMQCREAGNSAVVYAQCF